ncbi:hypothetical protein DYB34_012547 [Aphanomyces astaci]|uniref:Uncharacterized protein n=1 Tax=Aphanomyces astaci TaxID=112090 RepID=A0A3R7AJA2_APHAT|nr:hypothetical protein DYB34_012547 [Aphanomyces astaci]
MLSRPQHNAGQGSLNRQSPQDPSASARAGHCKAIVTESLTPTQKKLHAHLPLKAGVRPICLAGNVLLDSPTSRTFAEAAIAIVVDLIAVSDLFLLFHVQSEADKRDILHAVSQVPQFAWHPATQTGLQVHKILFCSTVAGNIALVRQIEPVVHVEDVAIGLRPFLPSIVFLGTGGALPPSTSSTARDSIQLHPSLEAYYTSITA